MLSLSGSDADVKDDQKLSELGLKNPVILIFPTVVKLRAKPKKESKEDSKADPADKFSGLSAETALEALEKAKGPKRATILEYVAKFAKKILVQDSKALRHVTKPTMKEILKRDDLAIPELDLFEAVLAWSKAQGAKDTKEYLKDVIPLIRFPIMKSKDIASKVIPAAVLEMQQTLELFTYLGSKEAGGSPSLGASIKDFNAEKRKGAGELRWRMNCGSPLQIDPDEKTVRCTGPQGAIYATQGFESGRWSWVVHVKRAKGNCMTVGVASKIEPSGSGRATGLHASGNCLDMQSGTGSSAGVSFRVARLVDNINVRVNLDVDKGEMSFEVFGGGEASPSGDKSGVVVRNLPKPVYPAIDMRETGLEVTLGELTQLD